MMSLLLSSVSASAIAASLSLPTFIDVAYEFDPAQRPIKYTLSNGNLTMLNTSGGNNYTRWIPTTLPIPHDAQIYYWEMVCPSTGPTSYNGYHAVVANSQYSNPSQNYNSNQSPIYSGSIGYRGSGTIWTDNATQRITNLLTYGNDDVVMFAFQPSNNRLWTGVNGVWNHNPDSDSPTWTATSINSGPFYPVGQGRDIGGGATINSIPSQFVYPIPVSAKPLGRQNVSYNIDVDFLITMLVLGASNQGISVNFGKHFVVHGGRQNGLAVLSHQTLVILET
jgi:hypothetical protein